MATILQVNYKPLPSNCFHHNEAGSPQGLQGHAPIIPPSRKALSWKVLVHLRRSLWLPSLSSTLTSDLTTKVIHVQLHASAHAAP